MSSRKQNELIAVCSAEALVCCLNCFYVIDLIFPSMALVQQQQKKKQEKKRKE